jgi:DNA-binding NarL/FixJ family response regulator
MHLRELELSSGRRRPLRGLSNKEIAQTLVDTVNTVETHLSHACARLEIRSRAQLHQQ